jgi:hypothetical protein
LHTAIAMANVRTVEMGGPLMLAEDIGNVRHWYDTETVRVPDAPGLGIEIDIERVRRFSEAWWTVDDRGRREAKGRGREDETARRQARKKADSR